VKVEGLPPGSEGTLSLTLGGRRLPVSISAHAGHVDAISRGVALARPGSQEVVATWGPGGRLARTLTAEMVSVPAGARAKNVIFFLGDGMGLAHRTAARVLSRGYEDGHPRGRLAMDTMPFTGLVMTSSLNALITDSAPGMAAYTTGNKANNNQMGVFPDDTPDDPLDNPAVEYLASWLRRRRGSGFHAGIVTTADLTDATPAACAVHIASRRNVDAIARAMVDGRDEHGVAVLMGGGRRRFTLTSAGGDQPSRNLEAELGTAGFTLVADRDALAEARRDRSVSKLAGLFHPETMNTAFDKVGLEAGYSLELRAPERESLRRQPLLPEMTAAALDVLQRTSPAGFFLVVEGASIDKRSHDQDAERAIWDVIELDDAVALALAFAQARTDTLVVVTADHETGGLSLAAVGNEHYQPALLGRAVRDYAANLRFDAVQALPLFPNYEPGPGGFPLDPDPSRKLIVGFGAGTDRFENFTSNRYERPAAKLDDAHKSVPNPDRDGPTASATTDNRNAGGRAIPGFLVSGILENGADRDPRAPGDTSSVGAYAAGHTAADVPLSAAGAGASLFTGTYENTDAFFKMAALLGAWRGPAGRSSGQAATAGAGDGTPHKGRSSAGGSRPAGEKR
jgi:alkaline phosphatase